MPTAEKQQNIVRRKLYIPQIVRAPFRMGLGLFLVLVILLTVSYTRVGGRMHASAAVPATLNFQARLLTNAGGIVPDNNYSVEFNLYTASSGGSSAWTETQAAVQVKAGYLSVQLGSVNNTLGSLDWSQQYWLTMNVNGDGEMSPRLRLTSVPYAFRSSQADGLTNGSGVLGASDIAQLTPSSIQAVNSALAALRINQQGAGMLAQFQGGGTDVFTIGNNGDTTVSGKVLAKNAADSATAFRVQNSSGQNFLAVDTLGAQISLGSPGIASTVQIGNVTGAVAQTINIGTNATASSTTTLNLGSIIGASSTTLQSGSGGIQLTSTADVTIGAADGVGTLLVLDTKNTSSDPVGIDGAMYYNSALGKFRCYENGTWTNCVGGGASGSAAGSFISGLQNVAANATGTAVETLVFTSSTAVSNVAGVTGFTAPAAGSFRSCLVKNNAAITAGTLSLRWRVNGVSVGATACNMNATTNRQVAEALNSGTVNFAAGDTIGLAFDTSAGFLPAATNDFTVYWTVEYYGGSGASGGTETLQNAYDQSLVASILTSNAKDIKFNLADTATDSNFLVDIQSGSNSRFAVQNNGTDAVTIDKNGNIVATGGLTIGNSSSTTAGTIRWSGADFEGYDGSAWKSLTLGSGGGGSGDTAIHKVKTANQTSTNNTLANDNDLSFPIAANENWTFRFVVQANAPATPDIKFAVTGPAGATCAYGYQDVEGAANNSNLACGVSTGLVTGNGTDDTYEIVGTVRNGATAGNVTLQWSQNATNVTATTVYAGSFLDAFRAIGPGSAGQPFVQGGNNFAGLATLGTADSNALSIITNGSERMHITATGEIGIGTSGTPSALLSIGGVTGNLTVDTNGNLVTSGTINTNTFTGTGLTFGGVGATTIQAANNQNLTIQSQGAGSLTLTSGSGTFVLGASTNTIQRANASLAIDVTNAGLSTLNITNSNGSNLANLDVSGGIFAGAGNAFSVNSSGDITSAFTALNGTSTANGAGAASTSLTLISAANFDIGNYVQMNSANCGGTGVNPCYAKITNKVGNVLTITPALTWANGSTVNEYHIPELGATDTASTLANRYGRGYFISGVAAGNGTTYFNEDSIETSLTSFDLLNTGVTTLNIGGAATTLNLGNAGGTTTIAGTVAFSGDVTAPTSGTSGYLTRSGSTLSPSNTGDDFTTSGNISTSGTGSITAANGLVAQAGGIAATGNNSLTGGTLTVAGGAITLNTNSNNNTSINTGSSTGTVAIGGGSAPLVIDSTAFDVSAAGALSGITTIGLSGAITGATVGDTINGIVINSGALSSVTSISASGTITANTTGTINGLNINGGALSGVTGLTFASGALNLNSGGITNTGSIAGATSINASGTITANTTGTINGLNVNAGALSGITGASFSSGNLALGGGNITGIGTNITASAGLTIASGGASDLSLDSASNVINLEASETTLRRAAAGNYTVELNSGSASALVLNNTGAGAASLVLTDGDLSTGSTPTVRLTNAGALTNITGLTLTSGGINIGSGGITNAGSISGITGLTFTSGALNLNSGGIANAGSIAGATTLALSGAISGATATNTINGLIVNGGALSGITGATFTSGILNLNSGGITNTGSIAGATTIAASGALTAATSSNTINGLVINGGALSAVTGITFSSGALNLNNGGITNTGSIAGATTLALSGAISGATATNTINGLVINSGALSNITTVNASGAITAATATNTINNLVINSGALSSVAGITFTSGVLNLNSGGITNAGSIAGASTLALSGAITGATATNTINGLVINAGALSSVAGIAFTSGSLNLNSGGITNTGSIAGATTIAASGAITAATATNTINGLVINAGALSAISGYSQTSGIFSVTGSGAITLGANSNALTIDSTNFDVSSGGGLSGITGFAQTTGNFSQSGTGTFGTGTGAISLNGATTIATGTNSATGLTINGTTGTAATALVVTQTGNAANVTMTNTARTAGALISLTQSTSAFTGTGLLLNFASGSGSFASGNFADFQVNGTSRFKVDNTGALSINTDSTDALHITNTSGVQYFDVDVTGNQVTIGNSDTTAVLFVLDTKTSAGDPVTGVNGGSYYNSNDKRFRCYEDSQWKDCIVSTAVPKTADQTVTNSAVFTNDTDLKFAMEANSTYTFTGAVNFSSTSAVADFKYTFTVPAGATVAIQVAAPTGAAASTTCNITASGQTCTIASTAGYRGVMDITGYVSNGANAGNAQLQFAQNAQTAGQSVTIYKGSSLNWKRTTP